MAEAPAGRKTREKLVGRGDGHPVYRRARARLKTVALPELRRSIDEQLGRLPRHRRELVENPRLIPTACEEFLRRFGLPPKIALLSHSDFGSFDSDSARKMREAVAILKDLGTPCVIHQPSYNMLNRWVVLKIYLLEKMAQGKQIYWKAYIF